MATIRKRGYKYHVQVRLKGCEPATASFMRLKDAEEWAARTETNLRAGKYLGQSNCHTFNELVDEYYSYACDKRRLSYWRDVFGNLRLVDVTSERINKEIKKLLSEETQRFMTPVTGDPEIDAKRERAKRTGATVNRFIAALSSCLSRGVNLEWIERNPCERVNKPKEGAGRVRFLNDEERPRLLEACRKNDELYLAVVLSLTTGARKGEVMSLRWGQIDFNCKIITLEKNKNGEMRVLGLVGEALVLLQKRFKVRSMADDRVFPPTLRAKKSNYLDLRQPWEIALKEAAVNNFHWHDLRHTAASYLAMSGVSLVEIAKILGHRTLAMMARYAHLSDDNIIATGEKLATRLGLGK